MSNVVQLRRRGMLRDLPNRGIGAPVNVPDILASNDELGRMIEQLAKDLDAVDAVIDAIQDKEACNRIRQLAKLNRATLADAARELSRRMARLPALPTESGAKAAR